jgi:hypothetical protein
MSSLRLFLPLAVLVGAVVLLLRAGRDLRAPPALPERLGTQEPTEGCDGRLVLDQSGVYVHATWDFVKGPARLAGKLAQDGSLALAGTGCGAPAQASARPGSTGWTVEVSAPACGCTGTLAMSPLEARP